MPLGNPGQDTSHDPPSLPPAAAPLPPPCRSFLGKVLDLHLLNASSAGLFLTERSDHLAEYATPGELGLALVSAGLLTEHQVHRVLAGKTHGLVLGNYRVLDRLGAGGMGTVFLAEHLLMKRQVAIKVVPVDEECPPPVLERFYAEMRVLADLRHPHVVLAYDAGELPSPGPDMPSLIYLVMERVSGGDLEGYVLEHGTQPIARACDWVRQAACGLQEAHDHHLVHRDVKPSNLLLDGRGQVKVVDFGLARKFCSTLTDHRALLGSIEFMPPEQSHDPSSVSAAADVYGLGATLFWLLTGEPPYPVTRMVGKALRALQSEPPRRLRDLRPDAPPELEELLVRMLDRDPARRPPTPLAVMDALTPFTVAGGKALAAGGRRPGERTAPRALIVDDEAAVRRLICATLERIGLVCSEAPDGEAALTLAKGGNFDVVLLDLTLPGLDGYDVCRRLREEAAGTYLKIIIVSGRGNQDQLAEGLFHGADDYVAKPFAPRQLEAKVQHALRLKEVQDRADLLARQVLLANRQLEQSLQARAADVRRTQDALLFAMAKMAESRDGETAGHLRRLQRYTHCLALRAATLPAWSGLVDGRFLELLDRTVPLHDIGKIGLPDEVLLKPGPLDPLERSLVETHPLIGDRILEALGREHGNSLEFLGTARAIVRHHHERHDGRGYPDYLAGDAIPAAARLVAVADVYDALRRQRLYKPALTHANAIHVILEGSPGQFDPALMQAFAACHREFERIYRDVGD